MMPQISSAAIALIKFFEGDPPPRHPEWPGGASGVTIGYGCDIGADPDSFDAWRPYLSADDFARLVPAKGVTGDDAHDLLPSVADIAIDPNASERVLIDYSLPWTMAETLRAFPGADKLPADSLGALISLVYNRGSSVVGDRRREMAWIKRQVAAGPTQWPLIAVEIAAMTYLWPGAPTASNLPGRRLREAALFAGGIDPTVLRYGLTGDRVAAVQRALAAKGFDLVPDGQFGSRTMLALWRWQQSQAYPATGIADDGTLRLLGLAS